MDIKSSQKLVEEANKSIETIEPKEVKSLMEKNEITLIDVRDIRELWKEGTIKDAIHIPRGMLEFWADPASPYYRDFFDGEDQRIIVFCAGGGRSVYAALALQNMGYRNVAHIADGFRGWKESDHPIEDVAATSRWVRR